MARIDEPSYVYRETTTTPKRKNAKPVTCHDVVKVATGKPIAMAQTKEDAEFIVNALNVHVRALKAMQRGRQKLGLEVEDNGEQV